MFKPGEKVINLKTGQKAIVKKRYYKLNAYLVIYLENLPENDITISHIVLSENLAYDHPISKLLYL